MDDLAWLRLQVEWGVDEAIEPDPLDRLARPVPPRPALPGPTAVAAPGDARTIAAASQTVEALRAALAGFDACALRTTATNLVFADGDPTASTVLIADVPGPAEDRSGLPFGGPAAEFLDRMLASAGLERRRMLALSLLPWRPPGDRKPAAAEVEQCLPFLLRHLALVRPQRALLFGALAVRTLLPSPPRRGRVDWQPMPVDDLAEPIPALPLPSPAHIRAAPAAKSAAWLALLRLRRALDAEHEKVK